MTVEIEVVWRGTVSQRMREEFAASIRKNVQAFLRHFPQDLKIHLTLFRPKTGADHQKLIIQRPLTADFGQNPIGTPVMITIEGSQGMFSLMTIEGIKDKEISEILAGGPYTKRPPREASDEPTEPVLELSGDLEEPSATAVLCSNARTSADGDLAVTVRPSKDEQVVESSPLFDVDLLQKVAGLLALQKQAQAELDRASSIEEQLEGEVKELERLLEGKRAALALVSVDVEEAKMTLSECSISDELREQARQAKVRLDAAFTDL